VANIPGDSVELLVFYGVGGQGKTALRKQFEAVIKTEEKFSNIHSAVLDLHERKTIDPDLALLFIRNELAQTKNVSFPAFDLIFSYYWQKVYPERKMPELSNSWLEGGIEFSSDLTADALKTAIEGAVNAGAEGVPFIGGVLKRWVSYTIKWGHEQWSLKTNEAIKGAFPRGVPENAAEIDEKLPFLLASDLAAHLEKDTDRRFVIFIDEYERVFQEGGFASRSRDNPFDKTIRALIAELRGTLIIVMSREQLPWAEFTPSSASESEWRAWIQDAHHRLEGLSSKDAEKFLLAVPVPEREIRMAIIDGAGARLGSEKERPIYPLLLDLQVDHYVSLKSRDANTIRPEDFSIQADSFRELRNKLLHRLLREYGPSFESTLKRLSVARFFDRDLFEFIVKKYVTGFPLDRFTELTEMSFIEESKTDNLFKIHNSIREALHEYLSPEDQKNTDEVLIEYYTPLATPVDCNSITGANIDALIELVYHQCRFAPEHVVDWWEEFSKPYIDGGIVWKLEQSLRLMQDRVETSLGQEHPATARSLTNLANSLQRQGRNMVAQPLYVRALKINEKSFGPDHLYTAVGLNNLALNFYYQGQYSEAQPLYERALKINEKTLGPDDPGILTSLNNLAANLEKQGRYSEAQPLYERDLELYEKACVPDGVLNIASLNNMASNLDKQGRYLKAQSFYERALKSCEITLGPNNPFTSASLNILAQNLDNQGRYSEAQQLYERALEIDEKPPGPGGSCMLTILDNMVKNSDNLSQYMEAEITTGFASKNDKEILGPDHLFTSVTLNNLANNLDKQGRYSEAQPLYERALKIREEFLGLAHPETIKTIHNLAANLDAQCQHEKAEAYRNRIHNNLGEH